MTRDETINLYERIDRLEKTIAFYEGKLNFLRRTADIGSWIAGLCGKILIEGNEIKNG